MDIELSEGFYKTIADILDYCVKGYTDSCTIKMNVNEKTDLKMNMNFGIEQKENSRTRKI